MPGNEIDQLEVENEEPVSAEESRRWKGRNKANNSLDIIHYSGSSPRELRKISKYCKVEYLSDIDFEVKRLERAAAESW
jgi:hypothetical protein